ncbi:MAG: AsmA family protein [candidate division Zixibacteria bacterium]|nr:AsmA family protein [candidate division Zixibacteria bacterium]
MNETTDKTTPTRRWRRWLLYPVLAIVVLVVLAIGFTQTPWFKGYLRDQIVTSANESLNATLAIDHISGNLFTSVTLHGIALSQSGDTLVSIPHLELAYELWPLLDNDVMVELIRIDQPHVQLALTEDSTWNIATIVPTEPAPDTTAVSDTSAFGWTITIDHFTIENGAISIANADSLTPTRIDSISLQANAVYSQNKQHVGIDDFRFTASEPNLQLVQLTGSASLNDSIARVDTLIASTEYNRIEASGHYEFRSPPSGSLTLRADTIDVRDISPYVAYDFPDTRPSLSLSADLIRDSLQTTIALRDDRQHIEVSGWANPLFDGLTDTTGPLLSYALNIDLNVQRMEQWVADTLASGGIVGTGRIEGTGLDPGMATVDADMRLTRAAVMGYAFDSAHLVATYADDSADVDLSARGEFGAIDLNGSLADLTGQLRYDLRIDAQRLNIQPLIDPTYPATDLTFNLSTRGQGYDLAAATGQADVSFDSSDIGGMALDTLAAIVQFSPGVITVDTLFLQSTPGSLTGGGTIGIDEPGSFTLLTEIENVDWIRNWLEIDSLRFSGQIAAQIDGTLDSLRTSGSLALSRPLYDTYRADSVHSEFDVVYSDSLIGGDYRLHADNLLASDILIPTTTLSGEFSPARYTADLETTVSEQISAALHAEYLADSIPTVTVNDINLELGEQTWTSEDTMRVVLRPDGTELTGLRLTGTNGKEAADALERQTLAVDGVYNIDSTYNLDMTARNISLSHAMTLVDPAQAIGGYLSLDIESSGRIANPELRGTSRVRAGTVNEYQFDSLAGDFSLIDSALVADFTLHVQGPESLVVAARMPLGMLTDTTGTAPDTGMDVRVQSHGFTLAILRAFGYTVENATGDLDIDVHATRSLNDPRLNGALRVSNGRVRIPEYGVDYRKISAQVSFDSSHAELTEFVAHRDDGSMRMTGRAEFADGLVSGQLDAANLSLTADKFYVVRHQHYEAQITANANLEGPVTSPEYGGQLTIRRSNLYLPALSEEISEGSSMTVPMLVAAMGDTAFVADTTLPVTVSEPDTATGLPSDYLTNLRGRLTVRFPRNTWLRDDDMNIEIEGELDVIKQGEEFELFGTIEIVRGDYSLYGKKFTIEQGQLIFEGGETVNPRLSIDAVYVFRTPSRDKRELTLSIGGRAESPTLSFTLDGSQIEEGDAVSYIVFGRSIAELTSGQRSAISDEGSSQTQVAKGAIASLLAGQLTQTLGDEFNLDVIEINAQSDWQSASFVVGKYITTDLFVSYQRGLGSTREDDEIVPEIVTLEYELSRHLFFQLVAADARKSGFDVIVKFDAD